jgi:hypothetical protein
LTLLAGNGGNTAVRLRRIPPDRHCQRHAIDPYAYLRDVLTRIAATPLSQLDQLLPDRWKAVRTSASAEAALAPVN